jgi:hypothetical protein
MKEKLFHPATFIALIALFVALSGSAYAVSKLPKNSVGNQQLQNSSVTTKKIKEGAVTSESVKDGSLSAADFPAGLLAGGSSGSDGSQGEKGDPGPQGVPGTSGPQGVPGTSSTSKLYVSRNSTRKVLYSSLITVATSLTLPAGNYLVMGKVTLLGTIGQEFNYFCQMGSDSGYYTDEDDRHVPAEGQMNLVSELTLSQPGKISLGCSKALGNDNYGASTGASIIAVEVGSITGP